MNGIDKITARLLSEAQSEADAIVAQAEAKCAVIREEYLKKAEALHTSLSQQGEKALQSDDERRESSLAMLEKKEMLSAKQEMVSAAFDRAMEKLSHLPQNDYIGFLAAQAAGAAENGTGEIVLNNHDRDAIGAKVALAANELLQKSGKPASLTLSVESREMVAGLILKTGDIEVNCTVETLLALCREKMAAPVAEMLFSK